MGRQLRILPALALCVVLGAIPVLASLGSPRHLEYRIAWNGLPAGSAQIDVHEQTFSGAPGYVVQASVETNTFVDLFWSFHGVARTSVLADGLVPLRFTYDRETNRVPESTWLSFDLGTQRALSAHIKGDKRKDEELDGADITDPITAVMHAQLTGIAVGDERRYHVFTGESEFLVTLRAVGEEDITVPAGHFPALKIEPEVWKVKDAVEPDQRLRHATVWVSRDPAHYILRVRGEVFVGAITLDLTHLGAAS